MPYPLPGYKTPTLVVNLDVSADIMPVVIAATRGANGALDPDAERFILGYAIRQGVQRLDTSTVATAMIDRWLTRFATTFDSHEALLFASDIALATSVAAATSRTLAQVYGAAAHVYLALYNNDRDRFFVPIF